MDFTFADFRNREHMNLIMRTTEKYLASFLLINYCGFLTCLVILSLVAMMQ